LTKQYIHDYNHIQRLHYILYKQHDHSHQHIQQFHCIFKNSTSATTITSTTISFFTSSWSGIESFLADEN